MSVDRITDQATGNYVEATEDNNYLNDVNELKLIFNAEGKLVSIGDSPVEGEDAKTFRFELTNLNAIKFNRNRDGKEIDEVAPSGNFSDIILFSSRR